MEQHFLIQSYLSEKSAAPEQSLDGKAGQIQLREELKACLMNIFPLILIYQSNMLFNNYKYPCEEALISESFELLVQSRDGLWLK